MEIKTLEFKLADQEEKFYKLKKKLDEKEIEKLNLIEAVKNFENEKFRFQNLQEKFDEEKIKMKL